MFNAGSSRIQELRIKQGTFQLLCRLDVLRPGDRLEVVRVQGRGGWIWLRLLKVEMVIAEEGIKILKYRLQQQVDGTEWLSEALEIPELDQLFFNNKLSSTISQNSLDSANLVHTSDCYRIYIDR